MTETPVVSVELSREGDGDNAQPKRYIYTAGRPRREHMEMQQ